MSSALDMSLDDIIKSNKSSSAGAGGRGRGRGRGVGVGGRSGPGPSRRPLNRSSNRLTPYSKPVQAPDSTWDHAMFTGQAVMAAYPAMSRGASIETGTKLYISNLDYGVSNEDIKELFSEVGDLKRYGIHYDRSGRSKGTAEVVFSRKEEALAALKRYNNVQLDGKPMKIEIVGTNLVTPAAVGPAPTESIFRNQNGGFRSGGRGRGGAAGRGRGGGRGAGRGRGRGRGRGEKVSVDDLDADLDKYHAEAMHTD